MKPFDTDCRGQSTHCTRESPAAVVALDVSYPCIVPQKHLRGYWLGHFHRLLRKKHVSHIGKAITAHDIADRAQVVVTQIGRIGVIRFLDNLVSRRKFVVCLKFGSI